MLSRSNRCRRATRATSGDPAPSNPDVRLRSRRGLSGHKWITLNELPLYQLCRPQADRLTAAKARHNGHLLMSGIHPLRTLLHPPSAAQLAAVSALDLDDFPRAGAQRFPSALIPCLTDILQVLEPIGATAAGKRLHQVEGLDAFLGASGCIGAIASEVLGQEARPVRAILFNKSAETNWALGWHQDRTICVKERRDTPGFGPWTVKAGMVHVAPLIELLAGMVTLRAHLDVVPATNAPLMIAPGSHRLGRIPESQISAVVNKCGTSICAADAGDVWLYSTPILHASDAATFPRSRRVLQVDYAAASLPDGLEWLGI